jgi:hypothetical protein
MKHTIQAIAIIIIGLTLIIHQLNREIHISTDEATPEVEVGRDAFTFSDLLDAIEWVESKGKADAVGDNGNAVGSFQIWKIYVDDVNRILRLQGEEKTYFYRARQVRSSSREMVTIYLKHYGRESRIGREVTCVDMAAMHCAGPDGYRQMDEPKVKNYVKKVMARLDKTR